MKTCAKQAWKARIMLVILGIVLFLFTGCNSVIKDKDSMIRKADEMEMIYIPAGEFMMGDPRGFEGIADQHQVYLDAYYIDQHEVTNIQYELCVADGACSVPYLTKSATRDFYYGKSEYDNYPVIYVNWDQAVDYCQWVGGALPTEAQWEKAIRGDSFTDFVWGDKSQNCDLVNYNECVGDTTEVGSYPESNSPYGLSDMSGNVAEWVADWFDRSYYKYPPDKNPTGPEVGELRTVRGGGWADKPDYVYAHYRSNQFPNLMNAQTGFRCVVTEDVSVAETLNPEATVEAEEVVEVETPQEQTALEPNSKPVTVLAPPTYVTDYKDESEVFFEYIEDFSQEQGGFEIEMIVNQNTDYVFQLETMIASGQAPCLFQVDQNHLYRFADAGFLMPLDGTVSHDIVDDMLPSVVDLGTYQGNLFALSQDEMGFALWGNRTLLEAAGVRIPTSIEDAWTLEEFEDAMASVKAYDRIIYPLDISLVWGQGYYSTSIYPILRGFGGDILDSETMQASGVFDSDESIRAMVTLQRWMEAEYIDPMSDFVDDLPTGQDTAMVMAGHWAWSIYEEKMGDNLVLIPMPDFGAGQAASVGGWTWVISQDCENPGGAAAFLEYLLEPSVMEIHNELLGMIPSRKSIIDQPGSLYAEGGPMEIFAQQLEAGAGVVLPKVDSHQTVVEEFEIAVNQIIVHDADVLMTLTNAANSIDRILASE